MSQLLLQAQNGILQITINRESKLNALNTALIAEFEEVLQQYRDDSSIFGLIITGSGSKAFAAGADIAEFAQYNSDEGRQMAAKGMPMFRAIETYPKPIIAAVNGFALGGGCELAMACHLRVAATNARFGQPDVNLGLIPGYGGTQRLPQLIGRAKALELIMTAEPIKADEALQLGLVNYVVEPDQLLPKCYELLQKIRYSQRKIKKKACKPLLKNAKLISPENNPLCPAKYIATTQIIYSVARQFVFPDENKFILNVLLL